MHINYCIIVPLGWGFNIPQIFWGFSPMRNPLYVAVILVGLQPLVEHHVVNCAPYAD